MEFEDHDEHEEEEEDEEDEEMGLPPSYDSLPNSSRVKMIVGSAAAEQSTTPVAAAAASGGLVPSTGHLVPSAGTTTTAMNSRYRECLKNHAVGIGLHAVDGCGEFMAAGAEGTLDGLKCAACNCHRNFHRKEIATGATAADPIPASIFHGGHGHNQVPQFAPYYRSPAGYLHVGPPQPRPLALPSTSGGGQSREDQEDVLNSSGGGGGGGGDGSSRKRFRTKFTPEQKERMLGLAERLGWRIQKHDEAVVQQFCNETGVRRQVLKVWMHNNKHTLGKKP